MVRGAVWLGTPCILSGPCIRILEHCTATRRLDTHLVQEIVAASAPASHGEPLPQAVACREGWEVSGGG